MQKTKDFNSCLLYKYEHSYPEILKFYAIQHNNDHVDLCEDNVTVEILHPTTIPVGKHCKLQSLSNDTCAQNRQIPKSRFSCLKYQECFENNVENKLQ